MTNWLFLLALLLLSKIAQSGPMNVTANVSDTCQIGTITDTAFGTISGLFQTISAVATGSITITCTPMSPYSLFIDDGAHADATSRRMNNGSTYIAYGLFQDLDHSVPWGDGTIFGDPLTEIGDGLPRSFPVYAVIPSGQTPVGPGMYSDIVVVSFSF